MSSLVLEVQKLGLDADEVVGLIERALAEDLGHGVDASSVATIDAGQRTIAEFRLRKGGVVAGLAVAALAVDFAAKHEIDVTFHAKDGEKLEAGALLMKIAGPTRGLLFGERTALNILGHLSGIATLTNLWVDAVAGTGCAIRDTRKTTPGLRVLEKYAVRCGGGVNHRMTLSDAAMIKDNHIVAAGSLTAAYKAVRNQFPHIEIEVEADSLDQVEEAVAAGADLVLLDNMTPQQCREAVEMVSGRAKLEASGGLTLDTARTYAETGVTYLAVGALTHSAPVLDIGVDLRKES